MTTKHTAGPWKVVVNSEYRTEIRGVGVLSIATLHKDSGRTSLQVAPPEYERDYNSRLIASAPELLEALNDCRVALTFYREWMHKHTVQNPEDEPGTNYPFGDKCELKARQAIAKAEGQP